MLNNRYTSSSEHKGFVVSIIKQFCVSNLLKFTFSHVPLHRVNTTDDQEGVESGLHERNQILNMELGLKD